MFPRYIQRAIMCVMRFFYIADKLKVSEQYGVGTLDYVTKCVTVCVRENGLGRVDSSTESTRCYNAEFFWIRRIFMPFLHYLT